MPTYRRIESDTEAIALLAELGAPERLVTHGRLVLEAAQELLATMRAIGVSVDEGAVRAGAVLHDTGKIIHVDELRESGSRHEEAGEQLLLERGVAPALARCCVTHAKWATMTCSLEELLVALADALWKGIRRESLEKKVIEESASRLRVDVWSIFVTLDSCFERIADGGPDRLRRSV